MCKLKNLNSQLCRKANGGIYKSFVTSFTDIADVIVDTSGKVTNFVMTTLGAWYEFEYDVNDNSPYYNQNGARVGNSHTVNQVAYFKFGGIDDFMIDAANGIAGCCALAAIHFGNSGTKFLQGIDVDPDTQLWTKSRAWLQATVNQLTGTSAEEDRTEITLNSVGNFFSAPVLLTEDEIEAL